MHEVWYQDYVKILIVNSPSFGFDGTNFLILTVNYRSYFIIYQHPVSLHGKVELKVHHCKTQHFCSFDYD